MNTPVAFQFPWKAKAGPIFETGLGLLSRSMKSKLESIEEFQAAVGGLIAAAYPPKGELHIDHRKVYHCPCRGAHKLIWFWRMGIELMGNSGHVDRNTAPATFECYGFGLECSHNKFGVRFYRNGEVKSGLE